MDIQIKELVNNIYEKNQYFTELVNSLWSEWSILKYTKWHNLMNLVFFDEFWVDKVNKLNQKYSAFHDEISAVTNLSEDYERFIRKELGEYNLDPFGSLSEHTESSLNSLSKYMKQPDDRVWSQDIEQNIWGVENFVQNLNSYMEFYSSKLSSLLIFSNISQVVGNTVIIGANGSGKSTFARQLKRLHSENISIISAQHLLLYNEIEELPLSKDPLEKIRDFQGSEKLPNAKNINSYNMKKEITEDFDNLINALIADLNGKANRHFTGGRKEHSQLIEAIEIWNSIIEHRELFVDSYWIKVKDKGSSEIYEFNRLSDGEKAIFYYIAHILIAREGNYVVVDEPENHINLAVCNLLWDKLEQVREDCTFVYLTHNVDFAVSRINATILWNKSFTVPDSWDIKVIPLNTQIPDELLVEIAGSRKNVLFCEGEKSSIDYKLYSILFENQYTVIPVSGHLDVINYCGAYNRANLFHGTAIGLIDGDYHEEDQIESWRKKGVYTLPYSEIENLICSQLILDSLEEKSIISSEQITEFKDKIFLDMKENADSMAVVLVRDIINNQIKNNLLKSKKSIADLTEELDRLLNSTTVSLDFESVKYEYLTIAEEKDYESYLKKSNIKGKLLSFANSIFGFKKYEDKVFLQMRNDEQLREAFIKEYFQLIGE